jgi:hypothetical protein
MRLSVLFAALAFAAPVGLCAGSASAQFFQGQSVLFGRPNGPEGPWCVHRNTGADRVEEDCSFNSFELCNREAQLNRGFCTQNFAGSVQPVRKKKGNRAAVVKRQSIP